MKLSTKLLTLALVVVPAVPAAAMAHNAAAVPTAVGVTVATTVTRYSFDGGISATGRVAENTGRGAPLKVRAAAGGKVRVLVGKSGNRFLGFPARCAPTATAATCPRALLEGTDDADLDPGTRQFRYGATVLIGKPQVKDSSNVMQKGVLSTDSQWKLQIGAKFGKAQCVIVGQGSTRAYIVRSTVSVTDGKWHRVMCLRTSAALYVFVDGKNRGRVAVPATVSIANRLPLRIGGPNLNVASDSFNGYLDNTYVVLG